MAMESESRDPREVYAERARLVELHRSNGYHEQADRLLRWAMADAMRSGLFFSYLDLHPLQKAVIADQHGSDVQYGYWRFEDGRAIPLPETV
jgi:hypothetical protein